MISTPADRLWPPAPFGWKVGEDGALIGIPEQQGVIREITELRRQGLSLRAIAEVESWRKHRRWVPRLAIVLDQCERAPEVVRSGGARARAKTAASWLRNESDTEVFAQAKSPGANHDDQGLYFKTP